MLKKRENRSFRSHASNPLVMCYRLTPESLGFLDHNVLVWLYKTSKISYSITLILVFSLSFPPSLTPLICMHICTE